MTRDNSNPLPAVEFRKVYLSFDNQPALADISFRLERGEMTFLTGVSGSGKSVVEFYKSDLPAIKELVTLDRHDH